MKTIQTLSYQQQLEVELFRRGLDCEIDMTRCGNLEMVCRAIVESLRAGSKPNKGFPSCARVFTKAK